MTFMNEYDIRDAYAKYSINTGALGGGGVRYPHLERAVRTLYNLMNWTNNNSDGWCYWRKPVNAAEKLMALIEGVDRWEPVDISEADLKKAITPIKSFCTRHSAPVAEIVVTS